MNLDPESERLLATARIGMLALNGGRYPLVNPAAFYFGGDSVWLTTSRHAVKFALARRRPGASFLVDGGGHCVLLEGDVEVYDPLSVPGQVRAFLEGPNFYLNLAGYAFKNASFIGGYLWDLARIPGDWWPQNRALLRLRAVRAWSLPSVSSSPAEPAAVPGVPAGVRRSLTRVPVAYLCTLVDKVPLMAPALWTADGHLSVVTAVGGFLGIERRAGGGVVIESHHAFRATRMVGAYLRGRFTAGGEAKHAVAERYSLEGPPAGLGLRFEPERATWWRGFSIQSAEVESEPKEAAT
ncbi:MAG: pyridoxamine 5'-phosphate oxidase family protein [Chloroflexi bacterium]|nr:MAG: pyridoxamine 5'-phosphate oxidase family protein [Chloroflexota bacterium]